jgi:hypothetical protein
MSNALIALIAVGLMLVATLTLSNASINWMDSGVQSWKEMVEAAEEVRSAGIEVISANTTASYVEALIHNTGKVHIGKFSRWDVLVQYYDGNSTYYIDWFSYAEGVDPPDNRWSVATIYADNTLTQQEIFEPGIINPGEVALFRLKPVPQPGAGTTNLVAVSSPSGASASVQFEG